MTDNYLFMWRQPWHQDTSLNGAADAGYHPDYPEGRLANSEEARQERYPGPEYAHFSEDWVDGKHLLRDSIPQRTARRRRDRW